MRKLTLGLLLLAMGIASPVIADTVSVSSQQGYGLEDGLRRKITTAQIKDNENDESLLGDLTLTVRDTQGDELPAALLQYGWNNWGAWAYGERPKEGEGLADVGIWFEAFLGITGSIEAGFNADVEPVYKIGSLSAQEIDFGIMDFSGTAAICTPAGEETNVRNHGAGWAAFSNEEGFVSIGRNTEDQFMNGYADLGAFAFQAMIRSDHEDTQDSFKKWIFAIDPNEGYFSPSTFSRMNGEMIIGDTFFPTYKNRNGKGAGQLTYLHVTKGDTETHQLEAAARMGDNLYLGLGAIESNGEYDLTGSLLANYSFGRATLSGEAIWRGDTENLETNLSLDVDY